MGKGTKRTKLASKVKKATSKSKSLSKELMQKAIRHIALEIIAAKPSVNDRTPRGFAEKLLKEAQEALPKLTMNRINYAIKNLKEQLKNGILNNGSGGSNIVVLQMTTISYQPNPLKATVMTKVSVPVQPLNPAIPLLLPLLILYLNLAMLHWLRRIIRNILMIQGRDYFYRKMS